MLNSNRVLKSLFVVIVIAALAFGSFSAAQAQSGPPPMFEDVGDAKPSASGPSEAQIMRERFVLVNTGMLFDASGKQLGKGSLPEISLNLFPDVTYTGLVARAWGDRWGTYWSGRLKGVQGGYFYLTVVDGVFMAHVASTLGVYEVSLAEGGLYKTVQIDQSKFIDDDPSATPVSSGDVIPDGSLGATADSGAIIDIMVAYTDDARAAAGGTPAIKATILTALNETNTSYANAGVTTRMRLVHVEEYSYTETGNISTDLTRFRTSGDGYFDSIHNLRNIYAADMVGLIVENGGAYCGLASAIMATATNAFQVTDRSCATGYYSFGHEFGHLQGARHDKYVDSTNTPYAFGHGYVHRGSTTATRWRTVMGYNDYCSVVGYNCTRLQWWSNPTKTYNSAAMGVGGSSENYKVLNTTDYTVANFRSSIIASDFYSSFNGSSSGWSAVTGSWGISSSAYYKTTGLASTGSSAKRTGMYGDVTYEVRMKRDGTCTSCSNRIIIRGNPSSLFSTNWWKPAYYFQYANDGSFSVYEATSGSTTVILKAWTASAAIVQNGWNTLKVIAVGNSLKFYINGTLVWSGSDSTLQVGQVGAGYYRDSANGTLWVDWAKAYNTPTADLNLFEEVAPGDELPGGSIDQSP